MARKSLANFCDAMDPPEKSASPPFERSSQGAPDTNGEIPLDSLALSVATATLPARAVIAIVFACISSLLIIGAAALVARGVVATAIARILLAPLSAMALFATLFVLAPRSRFGNWISDSSSSGRRPLAAVILAALGGNALLLLVAWWR